jgi:glycosyltransferase involved in cell wall biosynthesis
VIAPHVAGVPELVENGVSGFTVSPGDADDLASKIDALLSDPALCADMGRAGRAMVEAEFDVGAEA